MSDKIFPMILKWCEGAGGRAGFRLESHDLYDSFPSPHKGSIFYLDTTYVMQYTPYIRYARYIRHTLCSLNKGVYNASNDMGS